MIFPPWFLELIIDHPNFVSMFLSNIGYYFVIYKGVDFGEKRNS